MWLSIWMCSCLTECLSPKRYKKGHRDGDKMIRHSCWNQFKAPVFLFLSYADRNLKRQLSLFFFVSPVKIYFHVCSNVVLRNPNYLLSCTLLQRQTNVLRMLGGFTESLDSLSFEDETRWRFWLQIYHRTVSEAKKPLNLAGPEAALWYCGGNLLVEASNMLWWLGGGWATHRDALVCKIGVQWMIPQ